MIQNAPPIHYYHHNPSLSITQYWVVRGLLMINPLASQLRPYYDSYVDSIKERHLDEQSYRELNATTKASNYMEDHGGWAASDWCLYLFGAIWASINISWKYALPFGLPLVMVYLVLLMYAIASYIDREPYIPIIGPFSYLKYLFVKRIILSKSNKSIQIPEFDLSNPELATHVATGLVKEVRTSSNNLINSINTQKEQINTAIQSMQQIIGRCEAALKNTSIGKETMKPVLLQRVSIARQNIEELKQRLTTLDEQSASASKYLGEVETYALVLTTTYTIDRDLISIQRASDIVMEIDTQILSNDIALSQLCELCTTAQAGIKNIQNDLTARSTAVLELI